MIDNFIKTYKNILDEKIKNSTFLLFIIVSLIILTWIITPNKNYYSMASITNIKTKELIKENIIYLNWKKYKIYFEELK